MYSSSGAAPHHHGPPQKPYMHEHYLIPTPFVTPLNGFAFPQRIRVVGICPQGHKSFSVNLKAGNDILFHFNPRFEQHHAVCNSCRGGKWLNEEKSTGKFPFHHNQIFTIELVSGQNIAVYVNGHHFVDFDNRDDPHRINQLEVAGDIAIHSVGIAH